jgi:hypothetical protein
MTKTVQCSECSQVLTGKIQVYDKGKVYCETCNIRVNKVQDVYKVLHRIV